MYMHVQVRLTGGRAVDYYGSYRTVASLSVLRKLSVKDGGKLLGSHPWREWESYWVSKTEGIPTSTSYVLGD